ncbi:FGGY-family carbohydrate kinase [Nocardioides sp. CFH 31398]|uniref:FGGY-family carbohydrate kinase n=1 Tax=Nocardioides sp. CFH 31398 TaxID=2919579 RepID=UPI001F059478|nr:FGGY-family carbohydrate kinase [Nocardioides sp. CFH 31398]MCH1867744.1 hypothetical protein [Nocardioides sp. CFH 31398]
MRAATRLAEDVELVAVAGLDTASALVGTPLSVDGAAHLFLGATAVVGVETTSPLPPGPARTAGFSQQRGVDGTVLLQRALPGRSLLTRLARAWRRENRAVDLDALLEAAAALPGRVVARLPALDVLDTALAAPGDVTAALAAALRARDEPVPTDPVTTVRMVCDALASAYARVLADLARVTGRDVLVVHVTGPGSTNGLLCDALAARAGVPVLAGPTDAAALGNVLVQARAHGALGGDADLSDLRALVASARPLRTHRPARRTAPRLSAAVGR